MTKFKSTILMTTALSLALGMASIARADDTKPREAVISVSGEGTSSIKPDLAILNFSVMRMDETARKALDANTKAMSDVIAALKGQGIEARDLQTSNFSVDPQYDYSQNADGSPKPPVLRGYQVTNSLTVRVRDLTKVGAILDEAISQGVNQGGSVTFANSDPKAAIAEARKSAMGDALAKAKALTEAAGVKLGRIIEISENAYSAQPRPVPMMAMAAKAADMAAAPVPVEAGENSYQATVNVTIALEQ